MRHHRSPPLSQQAHQIIVERQSHQANEQGDTDPLTEESGRFRDRATTHEFYRVIEQVSPVEQWNGQQVENCEADADDPQEFEKARKPDARGRAGIFGDADGARSGSPPTPPGAASSTTGAA